MRAIDPELFFKQEAARQAEYWEQLRHHAAVAAMHGMLANSNQLDFRNEARYRDDRTKQYPSDLADTAVRYAEALINRLKLSDEEYAKV